MTRLLALTGEQPVELAEVTAGSSAAVELDRDLDITRGDLLADVDTAPAPADRFSSDLV